MKTEEPRPSGDALKIMRSQLSAVHACTDRTWIQGRLTGRRRGEDEMQVGQARLSGDVRGHAWSAVGGASPCWYG